MLEFMCHPVAAVIAATRKAVMCKASRPHDFSSGAVVLRIVTENYSILLNSTKESFCKRVSNLHVSAVSKISFHRMHHDVGASASSLIIRKRHRKLGVHYRKLRAAVIAAVSALNKTFFLSNNGRIAHLASGCRNREDYTQRKAA